MYNKIYTQSTLCAATAHTRESYTQLKKNGMLLKSYLKILIIIIAFGGCNVNKIQIEQIERNDFCQITNQLLGRINQDEKLKKHFYIENEPIKIYLDTIVENGIPFCFQLEFAKRISVKDSIPIEKAYDKMYDELSTTNNDHLKYKTDCLVEQLPIKDADLRIRFFYSKNYNLLALDATKNLKKPGYSSGYLYLVEIGKNENYKDITQTSWVE